MADPLEGCRAKIERAKEHFRDLYAELTTFFDLNPYGIASYDNAHTREHIYLAKVSRQPPPRWGVIAGEIVHQLRSALDHLAWQLVLDNGGTPKTGSGGTMFPILRTAKEFESFGRGKVEGVSEAVMTSIENIQPYKGGNDVEEHPLYILHHLDVRDKHQVLNLAVGAVRGGSVTYTDPTENVDILHFTIGSPELISPLKDGTILLRHPIDELTPEMNVKGQFAFAITFEHGGPAQGKPLLPTLDVLIQMVDQMITWFRPLFRQDSS